jgi:hypothetical protein
MKRIFSIIATCGFPCLTLTGLSPSEPLYYRLASDPALKGKGKEDQCMDYALALSSRLAANGIHGQLIFYRWQFRNTQIEGSHVFVKYRLPDKTEWIVDNEIPHPKAAPANASPLDLIFLLSNAKSAPVDVELEEGLNHLGYF